MRYQKRIAIGLLVLSLIVVLVQAGIWTKAVSHAHSETDKQNIEGHQPPNEMPGVTATFLLIAAGVMASIPRRDTT